MKEAKPSPAIDLARSARTSAECVAAIAAIEAELTAAKRRHDELDAKRGEVAIEGGDMVGLRRELSDADAAIKDLQGVWDVLGSRKDGALAREQREFDEEQGRVLTAKKDELDAAAEAFAAAVGEARIKHAVVDRLRSEMSMMSAGLEARGRPDLVIWPAGRLSASDAIKLPNALTPPGRRLDNILARLSNGLAVRLDAERTRGGFGRVPDQGDGRPAVVDSRSQPVTVRA